MTNALTNFVWSLLISTNAVLIDVHPSHQQLFIATPVVAHAEIECVMVYNGQPYPVTLTGDFLISSNVVRVPAQTNPFPAVVSTNEQPQLRNPKGPPLPNRIQPRR